MRSSNAPDGEESDSAIYENEVLEEEKIQSNPRTQDPVAADWDRKLINFAQAAERDRRRLLRVAERVTRCREDAEDVLQHSLLRAFLNLPRFREEAKMSTWLCTIVQNSALEYLRRRRGRTFVSLDPSSQDDRTAVRDVADPARNPEEHRLLSEAEEVLHSEIDKLVPYCRSVVQMCVLQEISQREVAHALDVSVATVKSRMFRSKQLLRKAFRERYGTGGVSTLSDLPPDYVGQDAFREGD